MNISIIGSGNTATVLGRLLKGKNHSIIEIGGRNEATISHLAKELNAKAVFDLSHLNMNSDIFIIAVNDDTVGKIAASMVVNDKIVVHTAGSISVNVLGKASKNYGILYPLQTLRKETNYLPLIPFLIDANNEETKKLIYDLASSISSSVTVSNDATRLQYHLSAVMVSNFSNHLFVLAKNYCDENNISFSLLIPLIEETVNRLHYFTPQKMQTGPAARNDFSTMQTHLQLLNNFPHLKSVYEKMSKSIIAYNNELL